MSMSELPRNSSRTEMRKALIRLRMEMHRQEIRHESQHLLHPLQRVRGMTQKPARRPRHQTRPALGHRGRDRVGLSDRQGCQGWYRQPDSAGSLGRHAGATDQADHAEFAQTLISPVWLHSCTPPGLASFIERLVLRACLVSRFTQNKTSLRRPRDRRATARLLSAVYRYRHGPHRWRRSAGSTASGRRPTDLGRTTVRRPANARHRPASSRSPDSR